MTRLGSITTILSVALPIIIPRARSFIRYVRSPRPAQTIRPLPRRTRITLNIFLVFAVVAFLSSLNLHQFSPPANVFAETALPIRTPHDVLWGRIRSLRSFTELDRLLKPQLRTLEGRRAYLTYGPYVLAYCPFCGSDEPATYAIYALPRILTPHIVHLAVLGLVTSAPISGSSAARWRPVAMWTALALAAVEAYTITSKDLLSKAQLVPSAAALTPLYWYARMIRGIAFATVDGALGWAIWATATRRLWVSPPSLAEKLQQATVLSNQVGGQLNAIVGVKNTVSKEKGLRDAREAYWAGEEELLRETMADETIIEASEPVLAGLDVQALDGRAKGFLDTVFGSGEGASEDLNHG